MKALLAQIKAELALTLRRGESVLVSIVIPVGLLMFLSLGFLPAPGNRDTVTFFLPATAAVAVIATAMVGQGIATGFERYYGVLRRLGTTPLTRGKLVVAKSASVITIEAGQIALLVAIAWRVLGWQAAINYPGILLTLLMGTSAFSGIGLFMAGTLRAQANLAISNVTFLLLLLVGGVVVPSSRLPGILSDVARVLPSEALVRWMDWALNATPLSGMATVVLIAWAVIGPVLAALTFSWE